jgi:hypothetical protein
MKMDMVIKMVRNMDMDTDLNIDMVMDMNIFERKTFGDEY